MSTTISYKGGTLGTVENESKKLNTKGTWLEDDIVITDSSSSGGSVVVVDTPDSHGGTIREITAQNTVMLQGQKTVTLTTSPQTITPDTGYDGFASVIVDAGQPEDNFIDRYLSTSDFESSKSIVITNFKFGSGFKANSLRLLNATGGSMYGCQYFLSGSPVHFVVLPKITDVSVDMFKNITALEGADFNPLTYVRQTAFTGCTSFGTLVLRKTSGVITLANINAFNSTKFADGNSGGVLYVPNDLIASYQSASNWSTILGYTNNQIKSIESTHTDPNAPIDLTTHYVDGTLITS